MAKSSKRKRKPSKKVSSLTSSTSALRIPSTLFVALSLMAFCFILYGNTLTHKYTQDDAIVIYDNIYTTQGIRGIPDLLKYDTFKGFFKVEGKDKLVSGGRYRPFSLILFAIEWQFFKKKKLDENDKPLVDAKGDYIYEGRPFVGHFMNIIFYGLTVIVLYLWLQLLLQNRNNFQPYLAFVIALGVSLLFAAHPIHTEAVANIKGRDEILTLLGALSAAYFSFKHRKENRLLIEILIFILFFIALMSKENAITFLAVIPLMYWFFSDLSFKEIGIKMLPFVGASLLFLIIRFQVLGMDMGDTSRELMNNPFLKLVNGQYVDFTFSEKMATIFYTLGKYIQLLLFPHPLTHDYYPRHVDIQSFGNIGVILSVLVYVGMSVYAFLGLKKKEIIAFGIFYFIATTSIISNIVFPVGTNMSERFMFMPSVGFLLVLLIILKKLLLKNRETLHSQKAFLPFWLIIGGLTLAFSAKTIHRNLAWKDNFTLFKTDVKTSTRSAKLLNAMGGELITQSGKPQYENQREHMLREAQTYLTKALEIHPTYKSPYLLLGNSANYLQDYEKSFEYYNKVLALDPDDDNAFNNLGITYREAGKYYGEKGDLAKAQQYLNQALKMRGEEYEIVRLLGVLNGVQGNHQLAIQFFEKALQQQPNDAHAHLNLGRAYQYVNNSEKAQFHLNKARQIDPSILK